MNAIIELDFTLAVVALFLIAYGVLRLPAPARTVAPAPAAPAAKPDVFRRDVAYINVNRRGAGVLYREAQAMGYKATARDGDWVTMKRNGG
jgi:hypothetical protein